MVQTASGFFRLDRKKGPPKPLNTQLYHLEVAKAASPTSPVAKVSFNAGPNKPRQSVNTYRSSLPSSKKVVSPAVKQHMAAEAERDRKAEALNALEAQRSERRRQLEMAKELKGVLPCNKHRVKDKSFAEKGADTTQDSNSQRRGSKEGNSDLVGKDTGASQEKKSKSTTPRKKFQRPKARGYIPEVTIADVHGIVHPSRFVDEDQESGLMGSTRSYGSQLSAGSPRNLSDSNDPEPNGQHTRRISFSGSDIVQFVDEEGRVTKVAQNPSKSGSVCSDMTECPNDGDEEIVPGSLEFNQEIVMYNAARYAAETQKDWEGAERMCSLILQKVEDRQQPPPSSVLCLRGQCYHKLGNLACAEEDLSQAIDSTDFVPKYYYARGTVRMDQKKYLAAIDDLEAFYEAIRECPADLHTNLGFCYSQIEEYDTAVQHYTAAISISSKDGRPRLLRAQAYRCLGREHDAQLDMADIGNRLPYFVVDNIRQAEDAERAGNVELALQIHRDCLDILKYSQAC